jgi:DNA-3-methyladenine glycosylase II
VYILEPTHPYSLPLSLKRLQDLPRQIVARVEPGPAYVRALEHDGRLGLVRVTAAGARVAVAIEGDLEPAATLAAVRRAFHLDLDLAGFLRHMEAHDPVMAALARRYYGARPIAAFDLWESLVVSIIAQQVNIGFAYALKAALVELGGKQYRGYPAFPGPATVATWDYADLQSRKFTRKKAEYIIDIARAITAGQLDLSALVRQPFPAAMAALTRLRGVGRWTAECLLMEAGVLDAFPAGDLGIQSAVQRFYGLDHRPAEAEVRELGRRWGPYPALACFYLWLGLLDRERA